MSNVINIPGAAQAPVRQPTRRGRLPKTIGTLYAARARRHAREREERERQWAEGFEEGRRKAKMERLLCSVLADVNAGQISGVVIVLRDKKDETDHYMCGGVFQDDPDEAADVAQTLAETLRESDCRRS